MDKTDRKPYDLFDLLQIILNNDRQYNAVTKMFFSLQHGVLSKEFVELMGYCNTIQAQYRDRNVERIQRQLKISEYTKHGSDLFKKICELSLWCVHILSLSLCT